MTVVGLEHAHTILQIRPAGIQAKHMRKQGCCCILTPIENANIHDNLSRFLALFNKCSCVLCTPTFFVTVCAVFFLELLRLKFPLAQSHTAPCVKTKNRWVATSWLSNSNLIGGLQRMNFMLSKQCKPTNPF